MSHEFIVAETKGRVGVATLNRPQQMNALNAQLMQELAKALYAFDADDGVGCIVITGNEKAFAAGVLFERRLFHSMFTLEDQKEGMAAFVE
jgi:enoyl-CoA hydratase